MASRILGSLGRLFITSGMVILLFVGYQLWGTGLQEASAQGSLESEFDDLLDSVATTPSTTSTSTSTTSTTAAVEASTTAAPTTTLPPAGGAIPVFDKALAEKLYREGGEAIARIRIPKIELTKVVVQGVKVEDLRNGPGHYGGTVFPGQVGNSGIAGHRTTYGAPFNRIDELVPGDEIRIQTAQGIHEYRVLPAGEAYSAEQIGSLTDFVVPEGEEGLGHIIVGPDATWVLGDFGDNRVTLTACHPKYSARQRIIVTAELVSDPVDLVDPPREPIDGSATDSIDLATEDLTGQAIEVSNDRGRILTDPNGEASSSVPIDQEISLDEGLDGDKSALAPALLWGFAAIAVYSAFKQLARRWRRWPAIAIGLVPVVVLMGLSFEKIDRYLPAG